jgi:hypothetical protein
VQEPGELDGPDRLDELGANRGRQMLDVGHLHQRRHFWGGDPHGLCAQRAGDLSHHDPMLLTILGRAQELLSEMGVDRGVGGASGRAGQRHGLGAQPVAAHQQLR